MSWSAVEAIVEHLRDRIRERTPKGWRVDFRVSVDGLPADAYRITGVAHRDGAFGKDLAASYREAHCITRDVREFRRDKSALVGEVVRCLDLVVTYLFTPRPAFRIGTKPSAKRLALDRAPMKTQARLQVRN